MSGALEIARTSATDARTTVRDAEQLCMLVDVSTCIGCKACEVACVEWNDLHLEPEYGERILNSYQTMPDMTAAFWNLIKFNELPVDVQRRPAAPEAAADAPGVMMLMRKDMCMHCAEPGCLEACPAEGAIVQYTNGIVDFQQDRCIGCGYCMTGCPFNIPKFDPASKRVFKCTMCTDRLENGLGPACVKACPTGCLEFGTKKVMKDHAAHRAEQLKADFPNAGVYDPAGVGGTGVVYVLHHADRPELYGGLPREPKVDPRLALWKGPWKLAGGLAMGLSIAAAAIHYFRTGPRRERPPAASAAPPREIDRYSVAERTLHWTIAASFVYLMLTGLGLYTPKLDWLLAVCGGGQVARAWHPIVGCVFAGATIILFVKWFKNLLIGPDDRAWLKRIRDYANRRDENMPPTGLFNPGQKLTFWTQVVLAVLLLASGIPIWFPESFSRDLRLWSVLVHSMAAVAAILLLVAHIFMAAIVTGGALRAMTEGKVTEEWARHHHAKWAEEKLRRGP